MSLSATKRKDNQMKSKLVKLSLVISAMSLSAGAQAAIDWSSADAMFGNRIEGDAAAQAASQEYMKLLDAEANPSNEDLIYGISQYARLTIYRARILEIDTYAAERRAILVPLWVEGPKVLDRISPETLGFDAPEYYYWSATARALTGEVSSNGFNLIHYRALKRMVADGIAKFPNFEGGGMYRIAAGMASNKKTQILGGYNPSQALTFAELAIAAVPAEGFLGSETCDNYHRWGTSKEALAQEEQGSHSKDLLAEYGCLPFADDNSLVCASEGGSSKLEPGQIVRFYDLAENGSLEKAPGLDLVAETYDCLLELEELVITNMTK